MAAVGFLGNVPGPTGMLQLVATAVWLRAAAALCFTNDLIRRGASAPHRRSASKQD